jgi:hypothetical protein
MSGGLLILSNLFERRIELRPSKDYLRVILLLHVTSIYLIAQSAFFISLHVVLIVLLMACMFDALRCRESLLPYRQLSYQPSGQWQLQANNGSLLNYEHLSLCFDGRFFLLFSLKTQKYSKKIVIFNDQVTAEDYSFLKCSLLWFAGAQDGEKINIE